mmetsp:Transcript_18108/g.30570  ORF Transcript_18108/g.30570 Transcript_18108/m.30570 type:complete len:314 (-) Transcript_18108:152-1093(-)
MVGPLGFHRRQSFACNTRTNQGCHAASNNLHDCIQKCLAHCECLVAAGAKHRTTHGRVEVAARHIPQGIDHGGQRACDTQGARWAAGQDVHRHRQHQDEGTDEFTAELLPQLAAAGAVAQVRRPHHAEGQRSQAAAQQLEEDVDETVAKAGLNTGQVQSDRHRRIEGAPADGTRTVGARDDAETDGQGKVLALLLLVLLGGCNVQHHETEHEGVEKFAHTSSKDAVSRRRLQRRAVAEDDGSQQAAGETSQDLHGAVDGHLFPVHARALQCLQASQRDRDGRIEISSANASKGLNCYEKHHTDGQACKGRVAH